MRDYWWKALLAVIALLFAIYVWPTQWRYENASGASIRVNRFTGEVEILYRQLRR